MNPYLRAFLQCLCIVWPLLSAASLCSFIYHLCIAFNEPPFGEEFGWKMLKVALSLMLSVVFCVTSPCYPKPDCCREQSKGGDDQKVKFKDEVQRFSRSESSSDVSKPIVLVVPNVEPMPRKQDSRSSSIVEAEVHHAVQEAEQPIGQIRRNTDCSEASSASASIRTQSTRDLDSCSATGSSRSQPEEPGIAQSPDEDPEERPEPTSKPVQLKSCLKEQPYVRSQRHREKEGMDLIETRSSRHGVEEGTSSIETRSSRRREEEGSGSSEASTPRHRAKAGPGSSESRASRYSEKERMLTKAEVRTLRERSKTRKAERHMKRKSQ